MKRKLTMITEGEIDNTLEASFPASDPPSWTLGIESGQRLEDNGPQGAEQAGRQREAHEPAQPQPKGVWED